MAINGRKINKNNSSSQNALLEARNIPVAPMIPVKKEKAPSEQPVYFPVIVPVFPGELIIPKIVRVDDDVEIIFNDREFELLIETTAELEETEVDSPVEEACLDVQEEILAVDEVVEENTEKIVENHFESTDCEAFEEPSVPAREKDDEKKNSEVELDTFGTIEHKGNNFLKFKKRRWQIRAIMMALIGVAAGLFSAGIWLILFKLAIIEFETVLAISVGFGVTLLAAVAVMLVTHKSDKAFAEELDLKFNLKARAQTMIQYAGHEGDLVEIQRQDAEIALSKIPVRKYKFKGLWIYLIILVLSAASLATGFIINDVRDYTPPEEVIPFELSAMQEIGIKNLITYVDNSAMEEEFKVPLSEAIQELLSTLKQTHTQKDMLIAVDAAMRSIQEITYASSTSTEVLNALWDSGDIYFKHLAKVLDTRDWSVPGEESWGDFAEKLVNYAAVLMGDDKEDAELNGKENLKFALDTMSLKLNITLEAANVGEDDEICLAIERLFNSNPGGFAPLLSKIDSIDETDARERLTTCLNLHSTALYDAIALNKVNANVGEYAMSKLAALLMVSIPDFERTGEMIISKNDDESESSGGDGGIGEGATYGSNDIVIDPLTGEPIEYGKLLDKYNAIMYEKLEGDSYTEEQKEAIKKYFDLLWSGLEKKEGN